MLPPTDREAVDDRLWRAGARAVVVLAGGVGLAGAPSVALGAAAAAVFAVYVVLLALLPAFGGAARPLTQERKLPWQLVAGADVLVLALAAFGLVGLGLLPIALLAPLALVAVHAHEQGIQIARVTGAAVVLVVAVLIVVGPGPTPTWRDGVAVVFMAMLAALAALAGGSVRDAEAVSVEDRASVDTFRQAIITTVSHELRTPLTIIQGITWALVSRWDQLAETQKLDLIDTLGLNIASLDASILHFLDAGRLARGEWEMRPGWVEVGPLVDGVATKLAPVLAGFDLQRRLEVDRVWGDEEALFRALELLLVNACRFSPPATPIIVKASSTPDGGWELAVVDRGQGIGPQELAHVFEPLWRADVQDTGVSRGAGLGLAIVKELADRHGGSATVTSTRQRGSTFRFILPPAPAGLW
jgi:signal transduction histidine kinase